MPILKEAHLREEKIESPNHYQPIYLVLQFLSTTSLLPKSKDGGNQFTWWNQPTCGSFQDPFGKKYYSFFLHYLRGDQETKKETQEENCLLDQLPCGSALTPAISCTKFKIHSATADSPMVKTLFIVFFFELAGTILCFTDQETLYKNVLGGPTPFWLSAYTSYLLYKVQDPFSACRQPHGQNNFFFLFDFREDRSLLRRPRNLRRECA